MKILVACLLATISLAITDSADASHFQMGENAHPPTQAGGIPLPHSVLSLLGAAGFLILRRQRN